MKINKYILICAAITLVLTAASFAVSNYTDGFRNGHSMGYFNPQNQEGYIQGIMDTLDKLEVEHALRGRARAVHLDLRRYYDRYPSKKSIPIVEIIIDGYK